MVYGFFGLIDGRVFHLDFGQRLQQLFLDFVGKQGRVFVLAGKVLFFLHLLLTLFVDYLFGFGLRHNVDNR